MDNRNHVLAAVIGVAALTLAGGQEASAQKWPDKTARIVTPFAPGGGTDFFARIVAQRLSESLGQQFIVDNRPGAGSTIGTEYVAKSPPDGYTFLMTSSSFAFNPALYPKLRYDSVKDFAPVTMVVSVPHVIVVNPSLPAKNVQDIVRLARSKPGEMRYSTAGQGSAIHLAGALFGVLTKTDLVQLPYKGSPPAVIAVIGGEAALMFSTIETIMPMVRSGRLRAIAVSTRERSPMLPDVPTVIESGVKDYDVIGWFGLFAPANTPPAIVDQMRSEVAKAIAQPDIRDKLMQEGAKPVGNTPAEFGRFVHAEIERWTKIIQQAGIKLD
ncbi:MAG: tripartite tricarboxylate transporter substrate binding protein [Burkholderiales bacterium]